MKKFSLIAILLIAVMMIVGCSYNAEVSKNADESESISFSANNTENNNSKIVTENESSTQISTTETTAVQNITKPKTEESTTASTTAAKSAEQKSAGQTTTKKQSETNAKKDYTQTTAGQNVETTKVAATTQKETTTKKQTTTEKPFDVSYWVSYAKDYARSIGLEVNSSASDCWDNPISANSKCKYLERDIKGMLNRYAKDEDVTQVWIWAEKTSADSYNIYIGYA